MSEIGDKRLYRDVPVTAASEGNSDLNCVLCCDDLLRQRARRIDLAPTLPQHCFGLLRAADMIVANRVG